MSHISSTLFILIRSSLYKIYPNPPNFSVFFLRLKLVLLSAATSTNSILICGIWHQLHEKMEVHDASTYYPRSQHKTQQRSQNKIQYFTPESSLIPPTLRMLASVTYSLFSPVFIHVCTDISLLILSFMQVSSALFAP